MYPTVKKLWDQLQRRGIRYQRGLIAALISCAVLLTPVGTAAALSDAQQLVVDSWRLVNQAYWNPDHLSEVRWRRQRQKAMEKSIQSSEDAYSAIEVMLGALETSTP